MREERDGILENRAKLWGERGKLDLFRWKIKERKSRSKTVMINSVRGGI